MVVFPHAKINLGLRIVKKRDDGYHDLETCFYPIPYYDILELIPSAKDSFVSSGIKIEGHNLVLKARDLLRSQYDFGPIAIYLYKNLPAGSGLGGGSSDASFTIKAINELFNLGITKQKMMDMAGTLGKDCPFFFQDKPAFATGTGNIFKSIDIDLKGWHVVVITPDIQISTKDAFSKITPAIPKESLKDDLVNYKITSWENKISNDFQEIIEAEFPQIREIRTTLKSIGAVYSSLSGSGSSVFAFFKEKPVIGSHFLNSKVWIGTF